METSTGSIFCTTEAHSEEGSSLNEYCIDMLELNHLNPVLLWNVWSCPLHHQLFLFTSSDLLSPQMQANLCKSLVFVQLLTSQTVELFRLNITHGSSLILFTSAIWMLVLAQRERSRPERLVAGESRLPVTKGLQMEGTVSFNGSALSICLNCLWNFTLISWFQLKGELVWLPAPNLFETQAWNLLISLLRNLELNRKHFYYWLGILHAFKIWNHWYISCYFFKETFTLSIPIVCRFF